MVVSTVFEIPKSGKYVPQKAKDYIIELRDGTRAWVREGRTNVLFELLVGEGELDKCQVGPGYYGSGKIDESTGTYVFYAERAMGNGKVGNPIFVGKIIKYRPHWRGYSLKGKWFNYKLPENHLYFVTNRWEPTGFYVIAKTPEAARYLVFSDLDCEYIDSRARIVHFKDEWRLGEYRENLVIYPDDSHILNHLGIEYDNSEVC